MIVGATAIREVTRVVARRIGLLRENA